ncbi:MAG: chaperone modulator CbpM [Rhodoblastus sp.]
MTLDEFSRAYGVERQTLHVWISRRWLIADQETLREIDVARARLIADMQTDLGVNDEGVDVALHLLDQIHDLRRTMADLRKQMGGE